MKRMDYVKGKNWSLDCERAFSFVLSKHKIKNIEENLHGYNTYNFILFTNPESFDLGA